MIAVRQEQGVFSKLLLSVSAYRWNRLAGWQRKAAPPAFLRKQEGGAETEIIGLLTTGKAREYTVAGVQTAIANRVVAMAGRNIDLILDTD